jgi:hypothetical protein
MTTFTFNDFFHVKTPYSYGRSNSTILQDRPF